MRKIVFAGVNDWANVCCGWARAINRYSKEFGYTARVVLSRPHRYGYQEDLSEHDAGSRRVLREADVFVASGDGKYVVLERLRRLGLRPPTVIPWVAWHAGNAYRVRHAEYDRIDAELGFQMRIITPNCYRFTVDDPTAVPGLPCMEPIEFTHPDRVRIGHAPSAPEKKGTKDIVAAMEGVAHVQDGRADFGVLTGVLHAQSMEWKRGLSIYIDQLHTEIGGFGVAALEAMAFGAAVFASVNHVVPAIDEHWTRPPIVNVQSQSELRSILCRMLDSPEALMSTRLKQWSWLRRFASQRATAERFSRWFNALLERIEL